MLRSTAQSRRNAIATGELWERLYVLSNAEKQDALDALRAWAGSNAVARPSHRILTPAEVVAMGAGGGVAIGAHTVTHPALPTRSASEQRHEIRQSKADLEGLLGRSVVGFAYPHGRHAAATVDEVRHAAFRFACTTEPGLVGASADLLTLPRVQVMDGDGEAFDRALTTWHPAAKS
jgi:peptidoglycan/xylan/chitin deacetylase (PgdA/CDA1 family)